MMGLMKNTKWYQNAMFLKAYYLMQKLMCLIAYMKSLRISDLLRYLTIRITKKDTTLQRQEKSFHMLMQ